MLKPARPDVFILHLHSSRLCLRRSHALMLMPFAGRDYPTISSLKFRATWSPGTGGVTSRPIPRQSIRSPEGETP
jgi:hypothetical protein